MKLRLFVSLIFLLANAIFAMEGNDKIAIKFKTLGDPLQVAPKTLEAVKNYILENFNVYEGESDIVLAPVVAISSKPAVSAYKEEREAFEKKEAVCLMIRRGSPNGASIPPIEEMPTWGSILDFQLYTDRNEILNPVGFNTAFCNLIQTKSGKICRVLTK